MVSGIIDNNGNLRFQTLQVPDESGNLMLGGLRQQYDYDGANRLAFVKEHYRDTPASTLWSRTYSYDRYGNRWISGSFNGALHIGTPTSQSHISATTNRLSNTRADYDNAGNLTRSKVAAYQWTARYDAENHQTEYCPNTQTICAGVAATAKTTYAYDGQGNRVKKVINNAGSTVYVYDAFGKLAAEYSDLGQLGPKGTLYRTTDHLGSTRIVTDSSGNIALRRDYFPFGEEIPASSTFGNRNDFPSYNQPTAFNQQFTAKERDTESDFDYFLARYYASPLGRFNSVDPENAGARAPNPQSWNGYGYALNNPLLFVDPDGQTVRVCNSDGEECRDLSDREFAKFRKDSRGTLDFRGGKITARNGNAQVGTFVQTDVDLDPAVAFALMAAGDRADAELKRFARDVAIGVSTGVVLGATF